MHEEMSMCVDVAMFVCVQVEMLVYICGDVGVCAHGNACVHVGMFVGT